MWPYCGMTRTATTSLDVAPEEASPLDTRRFYLRRSKRKFAPIRRAFVQGHPTSATRIGPLASFVGRGDSRALNAYLYLLAITSGDLDDAGWSYTLDSRVWARAFGTTQHASDGSSLTAVVRILDRLQDRRLIDWTRTTPRGPEIAVTLLREDGSGDPYTRPGRGNSDAFISLPFGYWHDEWDQKLSLRATAMLLVLSAEFKATALPTNRMTKWYGWSPDTAERGFDELTEHGLLTRQKVRRKAPNAPMGWTVENRYTLQRPFRHRKHSRPVPKSAEQATPGYVNFFLDVAGLGGPTQPGENHATPTADVTD
jgi:hypothetical protein